MRISDWSSDVCSSDLSGSPEYQLYALKQLSPEDMDLHRDRLVKLVGESIPLNRLYIMKKMPDAMWDDPEIQQGVAAYFNKMDISSRSWFLNRLKKLSLVSSKDRKSTRLNSSH